MSYWNIVWKDVNGYIRQKREFVDDPTTPVKIGDNVVSFSMYEEQATQGEIIAEHMRRFFA